MKITAIIPTYNRANFLEQSIKSIINQTYKIDEILIVDDGSTDNTEQVLSKFGQAIKVIKIENSGVCAARNMGIKNAKHDWIAFLDSDDIWLEDKIKKQIDLHENNENILFSHTGERWMRDGKVIKYPKKLAKPSGHCFLQNLSTCKIAASSVMIHKSIFEEIGLFDESLRVCEDYDMWLKVSNKYEIGLIDEEGIIKQAGHEQLSSSIFAIDRYHIYSLKKFINSGFEDDIKKEIIKKCNIIIKGALKHGNKKLYDKYSLIINTL